MSGAFPALSACLHGTGGDGGQEGSCTGGSQGMKVPRAVCSRCRTSADLLRHDPQTRLIMHGTKQRRKTLRNVNKQSFPAGN